MSDCEVCGRGGAEGHEWGCPAVRAVGIDPPTNWVRFAKWTLGEITNDEYADALVAEGEDEDSPTIKSLRRGERPITGLTTTKGVAMSAATKHMTRREGTIKLTAAQAAATMSALDYFLNASTAEECAQVFGSAAGTEAASRASDALRHAFYSRPTGGKR